jgi:hypothetical protein
MPTKHNMHGESISSPNDRRDESVAQSSNRKPGDAKTARPQASGGEGGEKQGEETAGTAKRKPGRF